MDDNTKIKLGDWTWFAAFNMLIGLTLAACFAVRMVMLAILIDNFKGKPAPELTALVLVRGPHELSTFGILTLVVPLTLFGLGFVFKGSARQSYLRHAPIFGGLCALLYLTLLILAFLLPFIEVVVFLKPQP